MICHLNNKNKSFSLKSNICSFYFYYQNYENELKLVDCLIYFLSNLNSIFKNRLNIVII
jgi:hypothetical protein